jgi:alkanesulfonate monooxygenase SsuD/methylene tetrahydromethanopterin reductase-like flavin-dependent oxidoreductase (luciferase family)
MRFHHAESMTNIEYYVPMAKAAEEYGYSGVVIPDSLIYPAASAEKYHYTDDGGREFLENKPFLESFIHATAVGVSTTKLEMTFNVVKLPVRPPVYSAKLAASLATLTNNRFNFGVGLSVWPEDYVAMGVDFAKRGKRFDECIAIVRGLTNGGFFEFHGEFYDLPAMKLNPVPSKPIPILIGGYSDAAFKRAAHNDGFMFAGGGADTLETMIAKINQNRKEAGTDKKPFRIFATTMGEIGLDAVKRNQDLGVTDMPVAWRNMYAVEADSQTLQQKLDDMKRFADNVIAKL